jgi:hypothetical protein
MKYSPLDYLMTALGAIFAMLIYFVLPLFAGIVILALIFK